MARKRPIELALEIAERKGMNKTQFAALMGVPPQTVTNWQSRGMPGRVVPVAADKLGVNVDEILGRSVNGARPVGRVPIISYVRAGHWNEAADPFPAGVQETDVAYTTKDVGANGYALRVEGDSMTSPTGRSFPEFSVVIVDPQKRDPVDRAFIIAKLKGHDAVTFKQFRRDELGRIWLQPLNLQHQPIREEFTVLGTVVQKVEDV